MKTHIISKSILALSLCAAVSCSEALNLTPISSKSIEGFYKTQDDFEQAVPGIYSGLRSVFLTSDFNSYMGETRTDNTWQELSYDNGPISRFDYNASTPTIGTAWASLYNAVNTANYIITKIDDVTFEDETLKKTIKGEAYFARGLYYMQMMEYWGGVPIVDKPITISEGYDLERASQDEVYDFIINDFKTAAELLPMKKPSQYGSRATAYAALGYLGKIYVYRSGYPSYGDYWNDAKTTLKKVLDGIGEGGFLSSYEDIYLEENEKGDQTVFGLDCSTAITGYGNPYPTRHAPNTVMNSQTDPDAVKWGGSPSGYFLNWDIVHSVFPEEGDLREDVSIKAAWKYKSGDYEYNNPYCKKYQNGNVISASNWEVDYIMLRYTDVYMLYGEACYKTGDKATALAVINKVRNRAGLSSLAASDIDTETKYWDVELRERRAEFCYENQRWPDLVRTDRAYDVMKAFLAEYGLANNLTGKEMYYFPIPETETLVSGLE